MTDIAIEQVLSSRYRTSAEADRYTNAVMDGLVLSTRAAAARLAIGRSLSIPNVQVDGEEKPSIDAKGVEIQGQTLFSVNDITAWIGLIVTHGWLHGSAVETFDDFRNAVRFHWHRGARLLIADWNDCEHDYDRFVKVLVTRRTSLSDRSSAQTLRRQADTPSPAVNVDEETDRLNLIGALSDIGITAEYRGKRVGPRMTRYEMGLLDVNQFERLRRNLQSLALSLGLQGSVPSVSLGNEAKSVLLDVAREPEQWMPVGFPDLERWHQDQTGFATLPVFVGLDIGGAPVSLDLANAPHLLIGGATGMGKSVCVHSLILSLLLRHSPSDLQLALVDPKQVEFSPYAGLDSLFGAQVVSEVAGALNLLQRLVAEMDARYATFKGLGASNIAQARLAGCRLPYIVLFVEEFADLVLQNKQIEPLVVRLAQKARAAGIHIVLATQRPDAKTFSGLIRSNIPTRIALTVQKAVESNIILDEGGAEQLLGPGDMLVKVPGKALIRAHGPLITPKDIKTVVSRLA